MLPGLAFLIFGIVNLSVVTYAEVCLHNAVEAAARYAAAYAAAHASDPPTSGAGSPIAIAQSHYYGPNLGTTPTYVTTGACAISTDPGYEGYQVTWTGTYKVFYGLGSVPFSLSAKACFP